MTISDVSNGVVAACALVTTMLAVHTALSARRAGSTSSVITSRGRLWWMAGFCVLLLCFAAYSWFTRVPKYNPLRPDQMELVADREFRNETVQVDGKFFQRCKFHGVRLDFEGRANTGFQSVDFDNSLLLMSNNPVVLNAWLMARGLGMMRPGLPFWDQDGHVVVNPSEPRTDGTPAR